jgi:hypothetical protein
VKMLVLSKSKDEFWSRPKATPVNQSPAKSQIVNSFLIFNFFKLDKTTMNNNLRPERWFYVKFALMASFIFFDVYLNSKIEYESMVIGDEGAERLAQLQVLLFGCTILSQFSVAAAFFLILCSTFPFQVGLLFPFQEGIFKWLLVLQLVYVSSSCIVGGLRFSFIMKDDTDLFRSWVYRTASTMHKIIAPCYYAASLRSAFTLGDNKYYTKDEWIPPAWQPQQSNVSMQ